MVITPDTCKEHQKLEQQVKEFLNNLGFLTAEATYHTVMPDDIQKVLQNTYTPTALYLRGRADRIAVHPRHHIVFEWEAKTHESTKKHDMLLEALPLCHHLIKSQLGVECLYCYHNPHVNHIAGFWVRKLPPVKIVMIPRRWSDKQYQWFKIIFERVLPGIPILPIKHSYGSGDPFLIIDEFIVQHLETWQSLIEERITVERR